MIAYLKGTIKILEEDNLVLVGESNIGWLVFHPYTNLKIGQEVEFFVYTSLKETEISLWGFNTQAELKIFRMLISVSGVGVKTACYLMKKKTIEEIYVSIMKEDASGIQVSGIGPKTAKKIILELKDVMSKSLPNLGLKEESINMFSEASSIKNDALDALVSLGYNRNNIENLIDEALKTTDNVEDVIKKVLSNL
jgi:Holliday junction DNA helicase RuvA